MHSLSTLILEDDVETLQTIFSVLTELERKPGVEFITTQYSTYKDVENMVNRHEVDKFDLILLDRDCKLGGSFHALDIEKFGADKIISISSVPQWNLEARERGITRVVEKDLLDLRVFAGELKTELEELLRQR